MNILVICHFGMFQKSLNSFVYNQADALVNLGHRVRVIVPVAIGKSDEQGKRFNIRTVNIDNGDLEIFYLRYISLSKYGKKRFNINSLIATLKIHWNTVLRDFRPDVIHAHTMGFDSEIGGWLKKKYSCPLIVTTHGSDTMNFLKSKRIDELYSYCEKADAIVAVSNKLRVNIESCGTKTSVHVIHNGFVPHSLDIVPDRDPYAIVQVGNLIPSKKTDMTIRAFSILKKMYPTMTLKIIGTGPEEDKLKKLCTDLHVDKDVFFTGLLPNVDVFRAMCHARFFVMVSKPEGFGIVYLEAMNAGCIIVGTEGQGIADVLENEKNGFLVRADDPNEIARVIKWCIENSDKAIEIAKNGKASALEFTWSRNAELYTALYNRLKEKG